MTAQSTMYESPVAEADKPSSFEGEELNRGKQ